MLRTNNIHKGAVVTRFKVQYRHSPED